MSLFGREDRFQGQKATQKEDVMATSPAPTSAGGNRTIFARPTRIEGKVLGSGDIHVEGEIKGSINVTGELLVADSGQVEAKVHARNVTVSGHVKGDISATERIELAPSANVEGNMTAPRILIRDGATFEGQVLMKDPGNRPPLKASSARKMTGK